MKPHLVTVGAGVLLGFVLSRIGFSSWDEVHRMFTFQELRMLLAFLTALAVMVVAWRLMTRLGLQRRPYPSRPIHPGSFAGGALFGLGWAVSGACPSIALVQLGEGQLAAIWTVGGLFLGNWLYSLLHARFFRWDLGSCLDD